LLATISFDFFFTQPYLSLRIATRNDTATALALLALALIASELGNRLRRVDRAARAERAAFERLCRFVEIAARASDVEDVVSSARAEIIGMFELDDCLFEPGDTATLPVRLSLDGPADESRPDRGTEAVLAPGGVALAVNGRGRVYGRLVLYAEHPVRISRLQRRIAISIAEELGLTLATELSSGPRADSA
jgi:two-component system sensor histidine kinase KdpD